MLNTLLNQEQLNVFNSIKYSSNNLDYADYSSLNSQYKDMPIVVSSWLSPHEDLECEHEDIYVFVVLHIAQQPIGEDVCFVYTDTSGSIRGSKLVVGDHYAFNFKKTHAVLPYSLAFLVFEKQSFDIPEIKEFFNKFTDENFVDTPKLAYSFLDVKGSNFSY